MSDERTGLQHNHKPGDWRRPAPCAACAVQAYVEALRERGRV